MKIEKVELNRSEVKDPFLIAEIGVNYYDIAEKEGIELMDAAKLMIKKALESGVDAVKFQTYKANTLASKYATSYWDTTKEPTKNQFELFKKFDHLTNEDYLELYNYTKKENGIFFTTCFDLASTKYFSGIIPAFKIASADLTNYALLKETAKYHKPILLSTGASKVSEIFDMLSFLKKLNVPRENIALLHCVLEYPTSPWNANLNKIKYLAKTFPDLVIGYSDHVPPIQNMLVPTNALLFGAQIIEKHFTLDKTIVGNDHYHAMDPKDVIMFRNNVNIIKDLTKSNEIDFMDIEEKSRSHARRSWVVKNKIEKGELLTEDNIIMKRPGTGISPIYWEMLRDVEIKANRALNEDDIIKWDDILY